PPAVHDRVKRLENRGFVRRYAAQLDAHRVGYELTAFVSAFCAPDLDYDAFTAAVEAFPEVIEIHSVAGDESYVLKVVTRSTAHLDEFLLEPLGTGCRLGSHRVIEPKGALPQAAWRIDNTPRAYANEILCDVDTLNVDSASFKQISDASN